MNYQNYPFIHHGLLNIRMQCVVCVGICCSVYVFKTCIVLYVYVVHVFNSG